MDFRFDEQNHFDFDKQDNFFTQEFNTTPKTIIPLGVSDPIRKSGLSSTRRSVAMGPSDVEFVEPIRSKRMHKKTTSRALTYTTTASSKTKKFSQSFTWIKFGWFLCALLSLRLIFMDGGVIDFFQMQESIAKRSHDLEILEQENGTLVEEIHRIRTNHAFQKKMAREHLGVIAKDEYLILFANEARASSL